MVSVDRSEKVMFKYYIFNHVYACFLYLNLKIVTLPAKKRPFLHCTKLYLRRFRRCTKTSSIQFLRCTKSSLFSFKYEDVLCTLSIVSGDDLGAAQSVFDTIFVLHKIVSHQWPVLRRLFIVSPLI